MLHLKIIRDDETEILAEPFDMRASGFSVEDEFMFFKAGAYTGNNTSTRPDTDFDRVTFFKLDYSHDPAPEGIEAAFTPQTEQPEVTQAQAGVVFDDSFADGDRSDGAYPMDTNWWTTSSSSAIEVAPGALGLVTGGSGRGIRTTFAPQNLAVGQKLTATFTFITPDTIGEDRGGALRVGLFDTLGRAQLDGDLSASSKSPNPIYDGLPGYMADFDIRPADPARANISIRRHKDDTQGRLLGTSKGYEGLGSGGDAYTFNPNTTYTGTMSVKRLGEGAEITVSLREGDVRLSEFTYLDEASNLETVDMLAFHVNSKTFGSSKQVGDPDNGIEFSNVRVDVTE